MLSSPVPPATLTPQSYRHKKESTSLPFSETDSFMMATLSPTSTASTDSSTSSSHSSPLHVPASSGSSSVSFSSLSSSPSPFASPSSSYPTATMVPASSNMTAALFQQQQQQKQAQQKQQAIASSLLTSMQSHPPASFTHANPASMSASISPATATTTTSLPMSCFPASASVPTATPSTSRRRGARRQRSPGHNRVPLWDTVRGKKLSGFASPMEKNLKRYLDEHPNCVLYDRNIHRVSLRTGEAGKQGEEEEDEEEEEEVPAELERIISSSPHSSSSISRSPKHTGSRLSGQLPPIRGQAGRQQGSDAIPRSMPMPVLSSSLPSHMNIPPPLSSSLPNTSSVPPPLNYSPHQSPVQSPLNSPCAKIAMKFEQLTMSSSSNSLSSLSSNSSTASVGKVRKGKKLTQSPRHNKPILLASSHSAASTSAMESSARSTTISRRLGMAEEETSGYHAEGSPIMAAAAVHPPSYHQTLSVSVPLPSHVPQSVSARPLTVDTHFEGHSPPHSHSHYPHPHPHHYPQLHSSSLSRSTTCSPNHSSSSHVDLFSASSLNLSPRRTKVKYARAHPYHGDRTPKYSEGRGRLDEEAEYKDNSARVGWSHSLPNTGPHPAMYAPPLLEGGVVDEAGHVCTCGGAQQQYASEGYYVQHAHGDPMFDAGMSGGYHGSGMGMDVHHMVPAHDLIDDYGNYGHQHHSYPQHSHSHSHAHSHSHSHSHSHNHAPHPHYHSHAHNHHHSASAASMHDNPPIRILSPVNGLSSAHSVSSESTHSSSSSNPSSKHLVYSRPMSPSQQPLSAHTSHSRTSPPLPAPATAMYAVEVETKADGQTVVHHHHHYQMPGPAVSPSAWLVEGGVDDRVMAEEGQWSSAYPPSHSHSHSSIASSVSPPPHQQHAQYMTVSPTPHHQGSRLDEELYLAPSDHSVGGGHHDYDLAAFDFTQLH